MAMGSIEYKELIYEFGRDISKIADDLYEASSEEIPASKRKAIVAAGQKKVRDYELMLTKLEGARRSEAEQEFADAVEELRSYLRTLAK